MNISHPQYEVTIKALIRNEQGLLLAKDSNGKWDLPGGRIDATDKSVIDCLQREVGEELGVRIKNKPVSPVFVEIIDYNDDKRRLMLGYNVEVESLVFKTSEENVENRFVSKEEFQNLDQAYTGLKSIQNKLYD